jgi:CRISPR-associated protein (TIGR02584 family)
MKPERKDKSRSSRRDRPSSNPAAKVATKVAQFPCKVLPITPRSEIVLLAVTGMSPAVLTETIWALAHEQPPVIPDRVVVITTLPGKARLEDDLFKPSPDYGNRTVWQALRDTVFGLAEQKVKIQKSNLENLLILDDIRLIASHDAKLGRSFPVEDIRTPADNETAADFILDEVRKITANADTTLVASLAGGRKTMGALLYAALSLLGRPQDRLTHVLVSEPFEDPGLTPRFYFPAQPETLHQHPRTGGVHRSDAARVWLADVPFVRLRELFPKQLGRYPGSFIGLVRAYSERIQEISGPPEIALDDADLSLRVQDIRVSLSPREYALLAFLAERCRDGLPPFGQQKDALDEFKAWLAAWGKRFGPFTRQRDAAEAWTDPIDDDFRKQVSSARAKLSQAGLGPFESYLLPQRGAFGIRIRFAP